MSSMLFEQHQPPKVGILPAGSNNQITDVQGVQVGQVTLDQGDIQTGVTVIYPHQQDTFLNKVAAGASIINGFGKSIGLVQLQELGVIETPIALSNTFAVPIVAQAQIRQAIQNHPEIGREWATVNPLVLECNDGYLNNIQAFAIQEQHYFQACQHRTSFVQQGSVGAGRGMKSFGLKGGIGTASRIVKQNDQCYTVGALVLSNFGSLPYLQIGEHHLGKLIEPLLHKKTQIAGKTSVNSQHTDKGSIIIIIATDAPLDARQLKRLSMRAAAGLARTGSNYGHGSGDIAIAFSTQNIIHQSPEPSTTITLHETALNDFFNAAAEATEQSIINALWHATTVKGRDNHQCDALSYYLRELNLME